MTIPYGRQWISEADIRAVVDTLESDFLTQGPAVPRFEAAMADRCEAGFARATSNATTALHLAYLALDIGPGDAVWTSPITYVATANAARICGADVDFVDIDDTSANLSVDALERKLKSARDNGTLPKAVVPVHMMGHPCDMGAIRALSTEYGFAVVEDASHAVGAAYADRPVGSCSHSDAAVFSFHPVKIITTGEGGMVLTNSAAIAEKVELLRSHGITREASRMHAQSEGAWYYEQIALGYNYRMTDIQAALGSSQLSRLDALVERRAELAAAYTEALDGLPLSLPAVPANARSSHHLFVVLLDPGKAAKSRSEVFDGLRQAGIGANVHYIPVHLQPYYRALGFGPGDYPAAERYYERAITLPLYPTLKAHEQQSVVHALRELLT